MCFHLTTGRHVWIQFWFILANFYIIFNLPPHTFPLCFYFVVCSIWLLSLSSNHILRQVGPNILFIYSLASILFLFCFKHINPSFTTLCSQMFSLAISSNFHTFHPSSCNSLSFFALLASWSTLCKGSVFLQFSDKMQSSIH